MHCYTLKHRTIYISNDRDFFKVTLFILIQPVVIIVKYSKKKQDFLIILINEHNFKLKSTVIATMPLICGKVKQVQLTCVNIYYFNWIFFKYKQVLVLSMHIECLKENYYFCTGYVYKYYYFYKYRHTSLKQF